MSDPHPRGSDGQAENEGTDDGERAHDGLAHGGVPVGDEDADGRAVTTGDIVIDAALRDLTAADPSDLDAQIQGAEALQRVLQGRLADLGE